MSRLIRLLGSAAIVTMIAAPASAATFSGDLFYTTYNGGQNVWKLTWSYNDLSHVFSASSGTNIASTNGADGIIFAPNGNLLVGGQGAGTVNEVNPTTGAIVHVFSSGSSATYHLALDPTGTKVYTSDFEGPLDILPFPLGAGTAHTVTGGDTGVTQIAFGDAGAVFYVDGNPNGFGDLGLINLSTYVTTKLYASVTPAHGLIYDPYTDLITMFGDGYTGTMNATNGTGLKVSSTQFTSDFDQGAVDGHGHALVAGNNGVTFLDYSISHDITHPDYYTTIFGYSYIDDVAPLVGAGSRTTPTPEPVTLSLFGAGVAGIAALRRRRKKTA
jgi:hypothetical protein